jgi:hypothetical protein
MKRFFSNASWLVLILVCTTRSDIQGQEKPQTTKASRQKNAPTVQSETKTSESNKPIAPDEIVHAVEPKPLSENIHRGIRYLVSQQNADGGWGQGGGWRQSGSGRVDGPDVQDPSDLGSTCIALLALERSGNSPAIGEYQKNVVRGLEFIMQSVEAADESSLFVTSVRGTQLQSKIGVYVDTFLTALALTEFKNKCNRPALAQRVSSALQKTIQKIEKNQNEDGTFKGNEGWASVLSLNICSKALNRASQNGLAVSQTVLERDLKQSQRAQSVITSGASASDAGMGGSSAGVALYSVAGNAGRLSDQKIRASADKAKAEETLKDSSASQVAKEAAGKVVKEAEMIAKSSEAAVDALVQQLGDQKFIAGFGNNGGEEFLSYMNIGEMLVSKGGSEWTKWDESMTANLNQIQNQDGSWSGHHCITGRTFCTSTALLTLMSDRATIPVSSKIGKKH